MSEGWVELGLLREGRIGYGKGIIIDDCLFFFFRVIEASCFNLLQGSDDIIDIYRRA